MTDLCSFFELLAGTFSLFSMFCACGWRGLNEPSKRRAVECVVSSFTNAVLCLQETKVGVVSLFSS